MWERACEDMRVAFSPVCVNSNLEAAQPAVTETNCRQPHREEEVVVVGAGGAPSATLQVNSLCVYS